MAVRGKDWGGCRGGIGADRRVLCRDKRVTGSREWQGHDERGEAWHICKAVWFHRLVKLSSLLSNATCHYQCVCSTTLS